MTATDEFLPDTLNDVAHLAPGDELLRDGRWLEVLYVGGHADGLVLIQCYDDDQPEPRLFHTMVGHRHRSRKQRPVAPTVTRT